MKKQLILIFLILGMVSGAASIDINSSSALQYYGGSSTPYSLDFEIATNGQVNLQNNLNLSDNNISNYWDNTCQDGKVVDKIYNNGTLRCVDPLEDRGVEGLSATLEENTTANQSIDMDENVIGNLSGLQDNSQDTIRFDGSDNVEIPNGDLNLSDSNITNYWSNNLCGTDRAVQRIHENGTVECTQQIEFSDNAENLSETLAAGNIANQTIFMDGNNLSNPGFVDGVDLDSPGNAINLTGNSLGVDTDSLDDSEISDNSLTNSSIDSSTNFSMYDLSLANNLLGTGVVNTNQISSSAVTNSKINTGAVESLQILDDSINESDLNTTDDPSNDEYLTYDSGSGGFTWVTNPNTDNQDLLYSLDNQPTESVDDQEIGIENGANITFKDMYELDDQNLSEVLVNGAQANQSINMQDNRVRNVVSEAGGDAVNRSFVLNNESIGTDDQGLTVFNNTGGVNDTIQIESGNNITVRDDVVDADADPANEIQGFSSVLEQNNTANQSIDMNDNNINDVGAINNENSQELKVGGNLNVTGNDVDDVSRVDFESGDSATGTTGGDLCLGDRC